MRRSAVRSRVAPPKNQAVFLRFSCLWGLSEAVGFTPFRTITGSVATPAPSIGPSLFSDGNAPHSMAERRQTRKASIGPSRFSDGNTSDFSCHGAGRVRPRRASCASSIVGPSHAQSEPSVLLPVAVGRRTSIFEASKRFQSAAPFVPPRHFRAKRDGDFFQWARTQLELSLMINHGIPVPLNVSLVGQLKLRNGHRMRWLQFRRSRHVGSQRLGFGFNIELA